MIHDLADKEAPRKSQWPFIGADSLLPGPRVGPQKRPRWECNSPGIISPAISTRCDEPLDIRVQIGLESTLGLLTLARTDKLSMFVVHACLRECQKAPILALYSISGDSGRNLPVVLARQLGLSSRRTALPLKHPEGHF
jgi:hypothetical protein